jgi:hypothetical protein
VLCCKERLGLQPLLPNRSNIPSFTWLALHSNLQDHLASPKWLPYQSPKLFLGADTLSCYLSRNYTCLMSPDVWQGIYLNCHLRVPVVSGKGVVAQQKPNRI